MGGGRRNLRQRKTGNSTNQRNTRPRRQCSNQDNNSTTGKRTQNNRFKFKPLTFLQDTNKEELESELHSISVHDSPGLERILVERNECFKDNGDSFDTPVLSKTQTSAHANGYIVTEQECITDHPPCVGKSPQTSTFFKDSDIALQDCSTDHLSCLCKSPVTNNKYSETRKQCLTPCPVHRPLNSSRCLSKNHQCSAILNSFSHNINGLYSNTQESPSSENLRRSQRLKEKYLEAVKLLQCPSPKDRAKNVKVLVEDTPESEYHVRLKRRQLRQFVMPL